LNDSPVLFLDELTKGLDPASAKELRIFIKETLVKEKKKTVFFSTHNLHEAEELADRIAFMRKGKITADGTIDELRKTMGRQDASIEDIYDYFMNKKD
ncbi:MAG: ABC transporter ATP-binding protein, partial [Candidatus Orphnella occulta]|nr:ABC transporter ATP-binding protein [Candidatus Orphnella occulta]